MNGKLLDIEKAIEIVLNNTFVCSKKKLEISQAVGYALGQDIESKESIPLFDSSAMDGYAVHHTDLENAGEQTPITLKIQGIIRAGQFSDIALKKNHTINIFTGAPVPPTADAVVMKEVVEAKDGEVTFFHSVEQGKNIRNKGEEFSPGEKVFEKGTAITPPVVGMLATLGYPEVLVYEKVTAAIIVTGDELQDPCVKLKPGQIRDSNSYALSAELNRLGIKPKIFRLEDNREVIRNAFESALAEYDIVISVGGVSVGDFDFVKEALNDLQVKALFHKLAIKPGKPNFFGTKNNKLIFGLPGNPVSAMISFELLVKPALYRMMGFKTAAPFVTKAILGTDLKKKPLRYEFIRANLSQNSQGQLTVHPTRGQGSHMLGGLAKADALILFPREKESLNKGNWVDIRLLKNWI